MFFERKEHEINYFFIKKMEDLMNRKNFRRFLASAIALVIAVVTLQTMPVMAESTITVKGTVSSDTTTSILFLSTSDGMMQIKLDSTTDVSSCKLLLPNKNVTVTCTYGSDAYWHSAQIVDNSGVTYSSTTTDSSTQATVTGTIDSQSKDDVIFFSTTSGMMEIKVDSTTNLSGCGVLMVGKTVKISVVRGNDAYMHAVTIMDPSSSTGSSSSSGSSSLNTSMTSTTINGVSMAVVHGTIKSDTNGGTLYLDTTSGTMELALDLGTDVSECKALITGQLVSVACYRGVDAVMHAAKISDNSSYSSATVDTSSTASVTGTIQSNSEQNIVYLKTSTGVMEIKLDSDTDFSDCGVIINGSTVTMTVARGSDAYMHAVSVTDRTK